MIDRQMFIERQELAIRHTSASSQARKPITQRAYWAAAEYARMAVAWQAWQPLYALRNSCVGGSLVIAASGPSMCDLPLDRIFSADVDLMTVNNSVRLFPDRRIAFHTVSDRLCYGSFAERIETGDYGTCFYRDQIGQLPEWELHGRPERTVFVPSRRGGILKRGVQTHAHFGIGNDSSVVVFSAQLAFHLGFDAVAIIGCDLNYEGSKVYAYETDQRDVVHGRNDEIQKRRHAMHKANAEFALLRPVFERHGRQLINATSGGNLDALPRLPLAQFLETRTPCSQ